MEFQVVTMAGPGSFIVKVHEDWAPLGAAQFKELVQARLHVYAHAS